MDRTEKATGSVQVQLMMSCGLTKRTGINLVGRGIFFYSNFSAFIRSVRQVLDWLATSGESYLSLHPIRDIKSIPKDVAQEWLEDNKKFREEAKVLPFYYWHSRFVFS